MPVSQTRRQARNRVPVVDTTQQFDRKIAALLRHESQHSDPEGMRVRVRSWNAALAATGGLPEGSLAEAFVVIETG